MTDDLALAQDAAREAAEQALFLSTRGFDSWAKGPDNPVTSVDLAVDALLKERLLGARPDYGWLSEETADSEDRLARDILWLVDPIDGTRDFARGRDGWAVSIALVVRGVVEIGILAAPALDRLFVATREAATLNGKPIRVSGRAEEPGMRLPVDPEWIRSPLWPEPWEAEACPKPNSMALRMALVACGEADGLIDARITNEWDVAAASLLLESAGGTVTDRHGGAFRFNKERPEISGIIAATPALHPPLSARLTQTMAALARRGIRPERT